MEGGYCRYPANIPGPDDHERVVPFLHACEKATENTEELPSTHPIRLCLALKLLVCHYGITNNPQQASTLAQGAFTDVMTGNNNLHEDSCKDGELNLQVLRVNLTLSTSKP
ncbi:hypothetical protein AHF37_08089 [Paragonimus kellicotti]|nr:hypothetical protein AHF37_08089 [Paragonimus kellicotti]